MVRALVTGGTGFLGANLVRRLLDLGHEVHLLVRPGHQTWRLAGIADDVRLHEVDLADRDGLLPAVAAVRPEWVFHLAAHGAYSWQADRGEIMATNVVGTTNLIDACVAAGVGSVVNAGTSSEYGLQDHAPSEDEAVEPNSFYALTKAWATMATRFAGFTTLRLYSAYGPWEDPRRLIPSLVQHGLRGELPPLASASIARDFLYVDDAVEAMVLAAAAAPHCPGVVYNVGTGVQTTLREAVAVARTVLAIEAEPAWDTMAPRGWDTDVWVADSRRITDALGWRPRVPFDVGFRRTVDWHGTAEAAHATGAP